MKKEVLQLNHKDNQKQYKLNPKLDAIAKADITRMDVNVSLNWSLKIRQRSKEKTEVVMIKIADRNKNGWKLRS